jgi:acetyl-CoA acyltransferase
MNTKAPSKKKDHVAKDDVVSAKPETQAVKAGATVPTQKTPATPTQKQAVRKGVSKAREGRRVVVVAGSRTPFTKAFFDQSELDTVELAKQAVSGLLARTQLDPTHIDEVVWGSVIFNGATPNTARELVLDLNLPRSIPGFTVTRACLSGLQAITHAAAAIERGDVDVVIAGGSDSVSNAEMPMPKKLVKALGKLQYSGKITAGKILKAIRSIGSPKNLLPKPPAIAERSTGKTMGRHADEMAEANGISREAQDRFALRSHELAHQAIQGGRFDDEVTPVTLKSGKRIERDTLVRGSIDPEKVSRLRAVFRKGGTVTAASSSPLTDGGSAVLLMSEEKAKELGFPIEVILSEWTYTALDPFDQLLLGPAIAIPKLLEKAGLSVEDIDVFEIHEAFAAQVLSVLEALESKEFAKQRLGREDAVGSIPIDKVNPYGGSIALGHPFAATGGRLITTAANELREGTKQRALVTLCAAGAMGGAAILERA